MTTAELWVHYHQHPLPLKKPLEPVVSSPTTAVLPYHLWIRNKCRSCQRWGCSGLWRAVFSDASEYLIPLCANCGLNSRHISKACGVSGFGAPHFEYLDLVVTLTYQSRTEAPDK